jgi:hypothetical protein
MAVAPGTDIFSLMNDPFADLSDCEDVNTDFGDIFDSLEPDAIQSEQRAVLLELTEEMAMITAELQQLKDDQSIMEFMHPEPVPSSSSSSSMKRRTRGAPVNNAPAHSSAVGKRRKTSLVSSSDDSDEDIASGFVRFMSKEELLNTITNELHPRYLEGVIRIVNPAFDPATATDEDLEFDINLLADDVLFQLMQYVHNALEAKEPVNQVSRKTAPSALKRTQDAHKKAAANNRIAPPSQSTQPRRNVAKKEGPRQRLMKRAPKKRSTASNLAAPTPRPTPVSVGNKRTRTGAQRKTKQQQQQQQLAQQLVAQQVHLLGLKKQKDTALVSSDLMREIFQSEEIIRVRKCMSDEEEDEDVDILA